MKDSRHAYLIISHGSFDVLKKLISMIDFELNDIYVHIDKKQKLLPELRTQHSQLTILRDRINAAWGDFSIVEIELYLMREASEHNHYAYYHIISGVDLPIKSQAYIHDYCKQYPERQYVGFDPKIDEKELNWRSNHYFLFNRYFQSSNPIVRGIRKAFVMMQDLIAYSRGNATIKKGSQWCSITHALVTEILKNESWIRSRFQRTYCPDEMFIQTIYYNSHLYAPSAEGEHCASKRFLKWTNGELLPITADDKDAMALSDAWFARKFDSETMNLISQPR